MAKSFFEKLKKGMDIKDLPKNEKDLEENPPPVLKENPPNEVKQQEVKEPSIVLATTKIILDKKSVGEKRKKGKPADSFAARRARQNTKFLAGGKKVIVKKKKVKVKKEPVDVKAVTDEREKTEKKWFETEGQLTVDVYQTDKEIVIQSAIAGIEPEDLDITIENDMVTIRGNREKMFEEKKRNYFYQECYWGQFSREIILPEEVDSSRTQATMKKGILTIRIPKIESKKKRKIGVINNDEE